MEAKMRNEILNGGDQYFTGEQIEEMIGYLKQTLLDQEGDGFFKDLAYEMKGEIKDLAMMIVDFRNDLKARICPEITDLAIKHIPQAADQLEGIIETTEATANKIMDDLENMQVQSEEIASVISALEAGEVVLPEQPKACIDQSALKTLTPLIDYIAHHNKVYMDLVSDIFVQMSFQDLTGQRIRRIMGLVSQMEQRLKRMIVSFGIKLSEHEKNPDISEEELQKAVDEKVSELAGPQREGQGLDQGSIDELLNAL